MPTIVCRTCGRQVYTTAPIESLFAEERRCPRCGAGLEPDRRMGSNRRFHHRPENPPEAALVTPADPPLAILAHLTDLAGAWRANLGADATITDVASTKRAIVDVASESGLAFVGGHPMAGREASGPQASTPDLFVGRPWVIVPSTGAGERDVARVEALAGAVGARPIRMTADAHDPAVAAIRPLPLRLAAALAEAMTGAPDWSAAPGLAPTGWAG